MHKVELFTQNASFKNTLYCDKRKLEIILD